MDSDIRVVNKLVLVYNANSGAISALVDSTKKLLSLHGCSLCSITHGLLGEKSEWKQSQRGLDVEIEYLHRDELSVETSRVVGGAFPCVLAETSKGLEMVMGPDIVDRCTGDVAEFRGLLRHHLAMQKLTLD